MKLLFSLLLTLLSNLTNAQTGNSYLKDLSTLRKILEKTPSFKAQIKGQKLKSYNALYNTLYSDTVNKMTDFKYFYNLSQLIFPLQDNHIYFYQLPTDKYFNDKEGTDYPFCKIDIDSLKKELTKQKSESIEGIYNYGKFYSVGVFKQSGNKYIGVILDSYLSQWKKGQIAIHLYEYRPNLYKAIYGHPTSKGFILQTNEKYQNQSLVNSYFYSSYSESVYSKKSGEPDFINLEKNTPKFDLKNITNDIQYLLVRTFQLNNITVQKSRLFYDSIKNILTAHNLILDLRNNEGGAKKATNKYFKLVKKYSKKGHVYILLNNGTLSQAELLTLRLKKVKNIITVGQTTKGMLTYGQNSYGNVKLPSQRFEVAPTDMNGRAKFLKFEDIGINPEILLNDSEDWIEQVIKIIREK